MKELKCHYHNTHILYLQVIKELEAGARDIHTLLQRIHRPGGVKDTGGIVTRAREKFVGVSQKYG